MIKPNLSQLSISAARGARREQAHAGNVIFTQSIVDFYVQAWTAAVPTLTVTATSWPWRMPAGYANVTRYGLNYHGSATGDRSYPGIANVSVAGIDGYRARRFLTTNLLSSDPPVVIGGLATALGSAALTGSYVGNAAVSHIDVPTTMIGPLYGHAVRGPYTANTTVGTAYLTTLSVNYARDAGRIMHGGTVVRITSSVDRGTYIVRWYDAANLRLYLANMDGTPFIAQATTVGVSFTVGVRLTFFNEAGDSPVSTGTITVSGTFQDTNRESYVMRIRPEKSGGTTAGYSQGSYWFSVRPWTGFAGIYGNDAREDVGTFPDQRIRFNHGTAGINSSRGLRWDLGTGVVGGCPGIVLDAVNQRLWFIATDGTNGSLMWWRYKCPETVREVASSQALVYSGYAIAGITMTSAVPRALEIGSDNAVYMALYGGANAGWVRITSGLAASQILASAVGKGANCNGLAVDRSRARSVTNTITTTAGTGHQQVVVAGAAFTAADVGRVITLSGLANDNGTYRIATYINATTITVEVPTAGTAPNAGGNVTFVGVSAAGTLTVGDRIYLFWNDATSEGLTTLTYMESLAWGTLLVTAALTKTNGRTLYNGQRNGTSPPCAVDQKTGVLFYGSSDVATQVNRFDPAGTVVDNKAIATYTAAGSGRGVGVGTCTDPTIINGIGCNPNTAFNEVWIATDAGHVQLTSPSTNLTAYERFFGSAATDYNAPTGYFRPDGSMATAGVNLRNVYKYAFGPDGRVFGIAQATSITLGVPEYLQFNRSSGLWTSGNSFGSNGEAHPSLAFCAGLASDMMGRIIYLSPSDSSANNAFIDMHGLEIHYQWVGGAWVPKEAVRGTLPDATSAPGLSCKAIHTTTDDLIWGVKVAFTQQGGATPANREFIGTVGQVTAQQNDGATTNLANTFDGSGFAAADVGRYLRIESGANQGVYVVATYVSATRVTLKKLDGTAWTATGTAGTLNYTKWEMSEDLYPGPECSSFYLASGFGKDTNQTIDNLTLDVFLSKTSLSISAEAVKPCANFVGPPGAVALAVYLDAYPTGTNPNYFPALGGHVGLPASLTSGEQLLDGITDKQADGTNGRASAALGTTAWAGRSAAVNSTIGSALTVDLGAVVEVGSVVFRAAPVASTSYSDLLRTDNNSGNIALLWKNNAAPAAASVIRTSGVANLSCAAGATLPLPTLSVSSGDLLGSLTTSNTDGTTTQNDNRFDAVSAPFTSAHVGQVLKILGGADVGSYRIISVDAGGAYCRVRRLDQTTASFAATASALSWEVRDAVREDDMIASPSLAGATHRLCIERLLTPTTAQVRLAPHTTLTNASWEAVKPSWDFVKRISHSALGTPPEVVNNGTYTAQHGDEAETTINSGRGAAKWVADLSDLATAARTGRYWKLALLPRFTTGTLNAQHYWISAEFYDTTGKRIGVLSLVDSATNAQFMAAHVSRVDFILGNSTGASHVAGANGNVTIAANGYTATLAGGNVWLGRQVRPLGTAGSIAGSSNVFTGNASDPQFTDSDTGRILRITTGVNAGYYRITLVTSGTSVNLARPDGAAVILTADAGPVSYAVHEGPQANTTTPDYIAITQGGVGAGNVELTITGVSADLKTLTIAEAPAAAITAQPWELRRRASLSTASAVDAASTARLLAPLTAYPRQPGDVVAGAHGTLYFWPNDVGGAYVRSNGQTIIGTGTFNGSAFTPDDVGRLLVITSGADAGVYRISAYTSATQITVVNAYTGAAASFSVTSVANLTYVVKGERMFRLARYATVLRQ